jgi:glycosyltransferase involved in cell wall biosynthesis
VPGGGPADRAQRPRRPAPRLCLARARALSPGDRRRGADELVLRDLAEKLGVAPDVHFAGPLQRSEVAQRYREADVFTLPSAAEAFGNVFAEALASGLPIVGSQIGGIPDLVEHGANGLLVEPGDIKALAGAIRYLGEDPQLRQEMAVRNRAKAEATLEWSSVTRRYMSTYEASQARRPARALIAEPTASIS